MRNETPTTGPRSFVMHSAARHYDLLVAFLTFGRERALRERLADLAGLAPGETVLDVACGTGTLAIAARRRVGGAGRVHGVDAAPEMIVQATRKAAKRGVDVQFHVGRAEALPFPDAHFDVVMGTLMLHHLPRAVREAFAREIRRVLKPGGRVLAVDFEPPAHGGGGLVSRIHRHGHVPLREIVGLLDGAGLRMTETGSVGFGDLQFAVARHPGVDDGPRSDSPVPHRSLAPLPRSRWLLPAALGAILVVHLLLFHFGRTALAWSALGAAVVVLMVAMHLGLAGGVHAIIRRHRRRRRST